MVAVRVDLTSLFDALAARDEKTVIAEIASILGEDIGPSVLAGRLAIPAALGDRGGDAVPVLVAAGRLGDWMRVIPPGPEPGAERRQKLLPAVPLVSAALFATPAITAGLDNANPKLPEPLFPRDIPKDKQEGAWGALREAVLSGDQDLAGRVLMGLYGSGTDYREMEGSLYYALCAKFAGDGAALLAVTTATQALDLVDWGDRVPAFFYWLLPLLMRGGPEPEGAKEVRAFLDAPDHSLDFVRTRLAMKNSEAAGASLRQVIARGATSEMLSALFGALKSGATPDLVADQACLAAAEFLAGTPLDAANQLDAANTALRVANSSRLAVTHVQDIRVLPLLFQAANLVNRAIKDATAALIQPKPSATSVPLIGGLIEVGQLRNIERQLAIRDEAGGRSTVRRYAQMAFPVRSLAGTLGSVAARASIAADANGRGMRVAQTAGEAYLALTPAQQSAEGVAFIDAAAHVLTAQPADTSLAQRIESATGALVLPA